jgi:hypothetical protein
MPSNQSASPSNAAIDRFPVDAQLLMLMPRAGVTLRHPDWRSPIVRRTPEGDYLEQRIEGNDEETSEIGLTRRIFLGKLSEVEWATTQTLLAQVDWVNCQRVGVTKGLAHLTDRRWQRLLASLITFLNPRQMVIVLYLYRLAAQQQRSTVTLRSNDLLMALGYKRTPDGGFAAKLRSQLHRDLVALHRTELVYAVPKSKATGKAKVKAIVRIQAAPIGGSELTAKPFDIFHAADYTYELAETYSLSLEFFEGLGRKRDCLWFPNWVEMNQASGSNAKNDHTTRLLMYLASRLKWATPSDEEYLILSKQSVFRNLDCLGSNSSRNNQIFWRTIEALKTAGYLISANELPGKKKINSIQFQINTERLRSR